MKSIDHGTSRITPFHEIIMLSISSSIITPSHFVNAHKEYHFYIERKFKALSVYFSVSLALH